MKNKYVLFSIYLIIFLLLFAIFFQGFTHICVSNRRINNFDSQNWATWEFSAAKGLLPYKDVFFPYGLFPYLSKTNLNFYFLNLLSTSILMLIIFIWLKRIFSEWLLPSLTLLISLIIVHSISGVSNFNRYGVSLVCGLIFSIILTSEKDRKSFLAMGVISGLITSAMTDQGIIISLLSISIYLSNLINKFNLNKTSYQAVLTNCIKLGFYYILGYLIGLAPFLYYLGRIQAIDKFLIFLIRLSSMREYAKIPAIDHLAFKKYLISPLLLSISFFVINLKLINKISPKEKLLFYSQVSLSSVLLMVELKNVMRPMGTSLFFIDFLLMITLTVDVFNRLKKEGIGNIQLKIYYLAFLIVVSYLFNIDKKGFTSINEFRNNLLYFPSKLSKGVDFKYFKKCEDKFANYGEININDIYYKVSDKIQQRDEYQGEAIFSFPSDPIFYVIFNQKPAPFLNSYDGSPLFAQNETIAFIKNNSVKYIIYNTTDLTMDRIPYYLRVSKVHNYILSNYEVVDALDNFLIMKKVLDNRHTAFFKNKLVSSALKKHLSQVYLGKIPTSEGLKLNKQNLKICNNFKSIKDLNYFLNDSNYNLINKIIIFSNKNNNFLNRVEFIFQNNETALITMQDCTEICVVNTNHLPAFNDNPIIKKIVLNSQFEGEIKIIEAPDNKIW